jgi:nucleoid-associated protein YgaU
MVLCPIDETPLPAGQSVCPACGEDLGLLVAMRQLPLRLYRQGVQLARAGDRAAAAAMLNAAVAAAPAMPEPRIVLGKLLAQQERYSDAIASWRQVLALDPDHRQAHMGIQAAEARLSLAKARSRRASVAVRTATTGLAALALLGAFVGGRSLARDPAAAMVVPAVTPTTAAPLALEPIQRALQEEPLGDYQVTVQAAGEGVRLFGVVPSQELRELAEQRVRMLAGAALVDSSGLRVQAAELAEPVHAALAADPSVGAARLLVEAAGETGVTLRGEVASAALRSHAEQLALQVPGVQFVDSSGVAVVGPMLADQVQRALHADPRTANLQVVVEQVDSGLRLTGSVPNMAARALVVSIAQNEDGVQLVDETGLRVQPPFVEYIVVPGDSLARIAKGFYGDESHWPRIYEANRDRLSQPGLLYPGTTLMIPTDVD